MIVKGQAYRIKLVSDQTFTAGLAAIAASVLTVDLFGWITHVEVSVKQEVPLAHHVSGTSKVTLPVPASTNYESRFKNLLLLGQHL